MITIFNSEYAPKVIRLEDEKRYAHEQSRGSSAMLRIDKADQEVIRENILEGRIEGAVPGRENFVEWKYGADWATPRHRG